MSVLHVALVGCGLISEAHIRAYRQHADRARITVCCDVDPEKAAQRAELAGGARVVAAFEEVLADPSVDAVEICTPHHLHADLVIAAAQAGGVTLFYGETNRTMPAAVELKRAADQGRIGRIVGMQATYAHWQGGKYLSTAWRYDPQITGGGQLLDGGIHYVDLMLHIGGPIEAVSCFTTRFRSELGGEDTATVNFRFGGGHLGTLFSSQAAGIWFPGASFIAFGTEGVLALGGPYGALTLHRPDLPGQRAVLLEAQEDVFAAMIGQYLATVLDGAPNPSPGELGRENLRVVLAAYESVRLGREVRVEESRTDVM